MRRATFLILALVLLPWTANAELEVASFFGDHMVLQRDQPLPVWGKANPGAEVTVAFRQSAATAVAGEDGRWMVKLPAQGLGEPAELRISSGGRTIALTDVLVGEVWLCGGQSNMAFSVRAANDSAKEIAAADYPMIRLFDVPQAYAAEPRDDVAADWRVCSPETVGSFSAVGYFFGRALWRELDVPIGLVSVNWGGSTAEAWMPIEALTSDSAYPEIVAGLRTMRQRLAEDPDYPAETERRLQAFRDRAAALTASPPEPGADWFDPDKAIEGIKPTPVQPNVAFLEQTDGLVHVRKVFSLTEAEARRERGRLLLGTIDNFDVTWINGVKIGRTGPETAGALQRERGYAIPDRTLRPGQNVVVIQVIDWRRVAMFGGGIEQPEIRWAGGESKPLADGWRMSIVEDLGARPRTFRWYTRKTGTFLYNGMLAPLVPAAFRGVIWYQGESNANRAAEYHTLFPAMIRSWRQLWGRGAFPFYFVQLANYREPSDQPGPSDWAELREAQRLTLKLLNTGMAVAIDIGEGDDIHPKNKQDVGRRLALWALAKTYQLRDDLAYSGPLFRNATVEDRRVIIHFDHVNGGLTTTDGQAPRGFAIAEENGPFRWADARIVGDTIELSHPAMDHPKVARYAWADNPRVNLVNGAGLPASPFRTDSRPLTTSKKNDGSQYPIPIEPE